VEVQSNEIGEVVKLNRLYVSCYFSIWH